MIFDYDGVIFNSNPAIHRCVREFFEHVGLPAPSEAEAMLWSGPPLPASVNRVLKQYNLGRDDLAELSEFCFHGLNAATRDLGAAFPGVIDLIRDLKAKGIPVGIATMKSQTEIDELGDVLVGLDEVDAFRAPADHMEHGSKKELLGDVIAHLKLQDVENGWMIGDRYSDIEAGKAHGLQTAAVLWGAGTREELENTQPDQLVESVDQLRKLLLG